MRLTGDDGSWTVSSDGTAELPGTIRGRAPLLSRFDIAVLGFAAGVWVCAWLIDRLADRVVHATAEHGVDQIADFLRDDAG